MADDVFGVGAIAAYMYAGKSLFDRRTMQLVSHSVVLYSDSCDYSYFLVLSC